MRWIATLLLAVGLLGAGCSTECERAAEKMCAGVTDPLGRYLGRDSVEHEQCLRKNIIRCKRGE